MLSIIFLNSIVIQDTPMNNPWAWLLSGFRKINGWGKVVDNLLKVFIFFSLIKNGLWIVILNLFEFRVFNGVVVVNIRVLECWVHRCTENSCIPTSPFWFLSARSYSMKVISNLSVSSNVLVWLLSWSVPENSLLKLLASLYIMDKKMQ